MKSAITAVLVILVDQITKLAIVARFSRGEEIDLLGSFLRLGHARNSGAVFGILRGSGNYFAAFSVVAAVIVGVVVYFARQSPARTKIALGLVLGGALGNLVDRLRLGSVVDFIDIGVGESVRWPSFNVADLAITVGVIMLVAASLRPAKPRCSCSGQREAF
ncbi:MAG: signal peptidase II [bacterium]